MRAMHAHPAHVPALQGMYVNIIAHIQQPHPTCADVSFGWLGKRYLLRSSHLTPLPAACLPWVLSNLGRDVLLDKIAGKKCRVQAELKQIVYYMNEK